MAVSVAASRLLPGAPVVSSSTYVAFCTCGMGVPLFEGVTGGLGVPEGERVGEPLGVLDEVPDEVVDGVLEEEEPPEGVPDPVSLPLGAPPVGDPLAVREPLGVLELVRVPDGVPEGVNVGDGVPDDEAPPDIEAVAEGVCEGVGSATPTTYTGAAYIVPALATEFHAFVVNVPAVAPVHTFVSCRMP